MPKTKKTKPRFVLGIDLDGVVSDFYAGIRKVAAEWLGVNIKSLPEEVSYGMPEWKLNTAGGYNSLHKFAVKQRALFRKLKPIQGAPAALRRLSKKGIHIRLITHRLFIADCHQEAVRQTVEWLDDHDIRYWDLCFVDEKPAVGANLYVEDTPKHVERLIAERQEVIIFTNSTNRELKGLRANNWSEAEAIIENKYKSWKTKRRRK